MERNELAVISRLRRSWTIKIFARLNAIAAEQHLPLARRREANSDSSDLTTKNTHEDQTPERSNAENEESLRGVYSIPELRQALRGLRSTNHSSHSTLSNRSGPSEWHNTPVEWSTLSRSDWQTFCSALHPRRRHVGVSEDISSFSSISSGSGHWVATALRHGQQLLKETFVAVDCQNFLRRGCPAAIRGDMWKTFLSHGSPSTSGEWNALCRLVAQWESIVSSLALLDIQATTNDDNFFVFQNLMEEILLPFYFDKWVWANAATTLVVPPVGIDKGNL